jgi:hypothetical protein
MPFARPGLYAALCLVLPMLAGAQTPNYLETWRILQLTGTSGYQGLFPIDLDGDGQQEFVASIGNAGSWGIGDFDGAGEYNLLWQHEGNPATDVLHGFRLIEFGNTRYLWMGFNNGRVDVYDVVARTRLASFTLGTADVMDFALADGNNDGEMDVVVLTLDRVAMLDPVTFATRIANLPQSNGGHLAVGNVAGDSRVEIVVSNGNVIRVDGAAPVVTPVFSRGNVFGGEIELGNLDGDGYLELVAHDFQGGADVIRAWDLDGTPGVAWTKQALGQLTHPHLIDIVGNAAPEVVYLDALGFHAIDTGTRLEVWSLNAGSAGGVTDYAVFDADGDGEPEILFGAGFLGPAGTFNSYDVATRQNEFTSSSMRPPYTALDVANVDTDAAPEAVAISSSSNGGGDGSVVSVYDAQTHELEWRSDTRIFSPNFGLPVHVLAARIANVDADPQAEIIAAGYDNNGDQIFAIDGVTHAIEHQWHFDPGSVPSNVDVADLDGDGDVEIIVSNVDGGTNFPGHLVYVIDIATGTRWSTPIAGTSASSRVFATDVGAAGADLVATNGVITKIRWSDRQLVTSAANNYASALAKNVSGGTALEIVAGRRSGALDVLDGDTLAVLDTFPVCPGDEIRALADHGTTRVVAICNTKLVVYDLATRAEVNHVETNINMAGDNGSLRRFQAGGRSHLLVGGWSHAAEFTDQNGNRAPVVPAGNISVHWRGSVNYAVGATDADNDPLSYSFVGLPAFGVVSWNSGPAGVMHYAASGTARGADSVGISVSDGIASTTANVAVTLTNAAPAAGTSAVTFHWRGSHAGQVSISDPDGDPTRARLVNAPAHGAIVITDATTGAFTYTPAGAFVGTDSFSYDAFDGADASAPRVVQITLTNALPAVSTTALSFHWRTAQTARLESSDPNGDPLEIRLTTMPTHGTLEIVSAATGDVRFTPTGAFVGTDSFVYDAFDGAGASPGSTVQVTLTNATPSAPADLTRDVTVGTAVTATLASTDADGDPLSYLIVTQPARGTLTLNASIGALEYTPATGTGDVTATVAASDGVSQSGAATLTFKYPATPPSGGSSSGGNSSSGGKKGGGGALDMATLLAMFLGLAWRVRRMRGIPRAAY